MRMKDSDEPISFTRSIAKHGKYYVITIPNNMIKSGEIDSNMMYKVILKPLKKKNKKINNSSF